MYAAAPVITSLYAGILAIMLVALSFYVIKGRFKYKVGLGDGGNPDLLKRIRTHGNFTEYVPMLLIMMAIMEINHMHPWLLHTFGILTVVSRACLFLGLRQSAETSKPRFIAGLVTFSLLLIGGLICIYRYII